MSNNSHLDLARLYPYLLEHSLRDQPLLKALREETARDPMARMQIAPEQGQFMALLVKLLNATRIIEVGTFTGYSSLCMAQAMPDEGRLWCFDISETWTNVARRYWQMAGVEHKISLQLAPALDSLDTLIQDGLAGTIDMMFVDADKTGYAEYVERALILLRPGGLLMLDNTLWSGRVADPTHQEPDTVALRALNTRLRDDARIDLSLLPMADGLTLARKR